MVAPFADLRTATCERLIQCLMRTVAAALVFYSNDNEAGADELRIATRGGRPRSVRRLRTVTFARSHAFDEPVAPEDVGQRGQGRAARRARSQAPSARPSPASRPGPSVHSCHFLTYLPLGSRDCCSESGWRRRNSLLKTGPGQTKRALGDVPTNRNSVKGWSPGGRPDRSARYELRQSRSSVTVPGSPFQAFENSSAALVSAALSPWAFAACCSPNSAQALLRARSSAATNSFAASAG